MRSMVTSLPAKALTLYLSLALIIISTAAGPAEAMFVPAAAPQQSMTPGSLPASRSADLEKIQSALELKIIRQILVDNGLSREETMARLNRLSDEQVHQLASNVDSLEAGGHGAGWVAGVIVLALLVVVLIFLVEGRIQIK
jgi:hypothetical protein